MDTASQSDRKTDTRQYDANEGHKLGTQSIWRQTNNTVVKPPAAKMATGNGMTWFRPTLRISNAGFRNSMILFSMCSICSKFYL